MHKLTIKSVDEATNTAIVSGIGVVFGGKDLEGDTFTAETELQERKAVGRDVFYHHAMQPGLGHAIGEIKSVERKEDGIWFDAQLDLAAEYAEHVLDLVEAGALGYSTATAGHLVTRKSGDIKRWPIVEISLTPTPAEPRTVGVERIKSLAASNPDYQAFLPSASNDADKGAKNGAGDTNKSTNERKSMSDNEKTYTQAEHEALIEGATKSADLQGREAVVAEQKAEAKEAAEKADAIKAGVKALLEDEPALKAAGFNMPSFTPGAELGDDEMKSYLSYVKRGVGDPQMKASNDSDWNIGTDADGGYAVPVGHLNEIIARRDDAMLADKLGVRRIPGTATTVNVPLDNEADGEFVSTAEAGAFDRDQAALDQQAFTLVKYTKKIQMSLELLRDEDSRILNFISDFVGRGAAKQHNVLFAAMVEADGTSLKTAASDTAIVFGELEDMLGNAALSNYQDDSGSFKWAMAPATYWAIAQIVGNDRQYGGNLDTADNRTLLGIPVEFSSAISPMISGGKSVYLGNWAYAGLYEAEGMTVLRDQYSSAANGQVNFHYFFRADYERLQAEAFGYLVHPVS